MSRFLVLGYILSILYWIFLDKGVCTSTVYSIFVSKPYKLGIHVKTGLTMMITQQELCHDMKIYLEWTRRNSHVNTSTKLSLHLKLYCTISRCGDDFIQSGEIVPTCAVLRPLDGARSAAGCGVSRSPKFENHSNFWFESSNVYL